MDTLKHYSACGNVNEIVLVRHTEGSRAELTLYRKQDSAWKPVLNTDARIGLAGLGKTAEGDMKTPAGDFGIRCAFGIEDNPGTALPYVKVDGKLYCCSEEGPEYNSFVNHPCVGEHMIDYREEYAYGLFPDYNSAGEYPKGSAIFMHVHGRKPYTAGCISVSREAMVEILKQLSPGARIVIS